MIRGQTPSGRAGGALSSWRSQTQKQRSYKEFLNIRIPYADTLPRPRCEIEWGQVDAVHRITRKQEVMD
jgi:hypothetical protein